MEEYSREALEIVVSQIRWCESQHPKANVTFDSTKNRINITYPLPEDFYKLQEVRLSSR